MAIFKSTVFDEIRKKLANTVLYKRDKDGIMRSKPGKIKNPKTPEQLTQRARMGFMVDLSRRFAPVIKEGFRERPSGMTVYNAFVSCNIHSVEVDENYQASVDFSELLCSRGIINKPAVTANFAEDKITVTQNKQDTDGTGMSDDVVYAGFYESAARSVRLVKIGLREATTSVEFELPEKWVKEKVHIYAFAVSKSKKHTSSTLYIQLV